MNIFKKLFSLFVLGLALAIPTGVFAQSTAMSETTLSAAVTKNDTQFAVASASGTYTIVGNYYIIDSEVGQVQSIAGTVVRVTRGLMGTKASAHLSGKSVLFTPASGFVSTDPDPGSCSTADYTFDPIFNPLTGRKFRCLGGKISLFGVGSFPGGAGIQLSMQTYTAASATAGSLKHIPGVTFINGTTLAMTITAPTIDENGMVMQIVSTNASAQTLTFATVGFNGNTTSTDVATFGGAIGDNIVIFAYEGVWWVISTRNVTLG